jgi:hypothetical protein
MFLTGAQIEVASFIIWILATKRKQIPLSTIQGGKQILWMWQQR